MVWFFFFNGFSRSTGSVVNRQRGQWLTINRFPASKELSGHPSGPGRSTCAALAKFVCLRHLKTLAIRVPRGGIAVSLAPG